jgi:tetrapyrrole methylase family protein / MazG family protein
MKQAPSPPLYNFPMPKKIAKRKRTVRKKSSRDRFAPPRTGPVFEKLVAVMSRLRAPKGCPWDREQTHATLRTYLIEEAYEVLDALDSSDDAKFAEELGDLLLQVLFHAQIAHEENRFDVTDVIRAIHDKMVRRHPHVFGTTSARTAADVLRNWEIIKKEERAKSGTPEKEKSPESILDGVPKHIPALLEANQLTRKAARIGFDWHNVDGIFAKLTEETNELQAVLGTKSPDPSRVEGELGDILFVAVNLARFLNVDPEIALKKTSVKFSSRFRTMERLAREKGTTLPQTPRPQMESLWDQAKSLE